MTSASKCVVIAFEVLRICSCGALGSQAGAQCLLRLLPSPWKMHWATESKLATINRAMHLTTCSLVLHLAATLCRARGRDAAARCEGGACVHDAPQDRMPEEDAYTACCVSSVKTTCLDVGRASYSHGRERTEHLFKSTPCVPCLLHEPLTG